MKEEWRNVKDFEGWYEVSDLGQVRRARAGKATKPGRVLKQQVGKNRRLRVTLSKNSEQTTREVARLVADAFLGPKPPGKEINHIDYNCQNNRVANLEFVTPSENVIHAYANGFVGGRGERQGQAKLTDHDVRLIRNSPLGSTALATHYRVTRGTIKKVRSCDTWKHVKD